MAACGKALVLRCLFEMLQPILLPAQLLWEILGMKTVTRILCFLDLNQIKF